MADDLVEVTLNKMVHGGQALGDLPDGRKVFVWNGLPGEKVGVRLMKQKRSYAEAIAEEIYTPSPERVPPRETNFLATSPWQMVSFEAENSYKAEITREIFTQAHIHLPDFGSAQHTKQEWNYRNKMEYSFWGDEDGLHLALHRRGSHSKDIVNGSALALPAVDTAARAICEQLSNAQVRAGDLKTLIVRADQQGEASAALYTKQMNIQHIDLPDTVAGLRVYYSNPRSPASVPTQLIYELGDSHLHDQLGGQDFIYDSESFFQVFPDAFSLALLTLRGQIQAPRVVDLYAGVGSIGLSVARDAVTLIESDPKTAAMARRNAEKSPLAVTVVESLSEQATDSIQSNLPVIVDPPRAGLHSKVIEALLAVLPPVIYYLSCNPATQARDVALLQERYEVRSFEVYNFFPKTPHIESLAVLHLV